MERRRRMRGAKALAAVTAVFAVSAFVPTVAFGQGNVVEDLLNGVNGILGGGGGGGGAVEPQAGVPPEYTPPLNGGNPHGQGEIAGVDLLPSNDLPGPGGSVDDSEEELTVGQSRGEQDENGDYHGRVVLLDENLVNLVNISVETEEGDDVNEGPLGPLNTALSQGCVAFGQAADCLQLLAVRSETTDTGSQNSFQIANVNLANAALGGLSASAGRSEGNISGPGNEPGNGDPCQEAEGESNVAEAGLTAPGGLPGLEATVLDADSNSTACNNGFQDVNNGGSAIGLSGGGQGTVIPPGCEEGTTNNMFLPLAPILSAVCNADDNSEDGPFDVQVTDGPYGVREALSVFLLPIIVDVPLDAPALRQAADTIPLVKLWAAGAESHAEPPAGPGGGGVTPNPTPADTGGGGDDDGSPGRGDEGEGPAGPAAGDAQAGDEDLAFTGANMFVLAVIGGMLMIGGLGLARASTRRSRRLAA